MIGITREHGVEGGIHGKCGVSAPYTWVITSIDPVTEGSDEEATVVGPQEEDEYAALARTIREGRWFRLVDNHGMAHYGGFIMGDYAGDEPLRDFGSLKGCARIEYDD